MQLTATDSSSDEEPYGDEWRILAVSRSKNEGRDEVPWYDGPPKRQLDARVLRALERCAREVVDGTLASSGCSRDRASSHGRPEAVSEEGAAHAPLLAPKCRAPFAPPGGDNVFSI